MTSLLAYRVMSGRCCPATDEHTGHEPLSTAHGTTIFSDTSFIDYDNNIAAASGGQSVRDDKRDAFLGVRPLR